MEKETNVFNEEIKDHYNKIIQLCSLSSSNYLIEIKAIVVDSRADMSHYSASLSFVAEFNIDENMIENYSQKIIFDTRNNSCRFDINFDSDASHIQLKLINRNNYICRFGIFSTVMQM